MGKLRKPEEPVGSLREVLGSPEKLANPLLNEYRDGIGPATRTLEAIGQGRTEGLVSHGSPLRPGIQSCA